MKYTRWYASAITIFVFALIALIQGQPAMAATCAADLQISDFRLIDATGQTRTKFSNTEAIYPKVTIKNAGSATATSSTAATITTFYRSAETTAPVNLASDANTTLRNGQFAKNTTKVYSAIPDGENARYFNNYRYWTMPVAGTYVARVFVNSDNAACESNLANNQATYTYSVSANGAETVNLVQSANPGSDQVTSTSTGWRNSLVYTYRASVLQQVGFYNTGANAQYEVRLSNKDGLLGTVIAQGILDGSQDGYFIDNTTLALDKNQYYIFRVNQRSGSTKLTKHATQYQNFGFMAYSGGNTAASSVGTYQIRFKYTVSRVRLTFNQAEFTKLGFPTPQVNNPQTLTGEPLNRFKNYTMNQAVLAGKLTNMNPAFIAAWAERENDFDTLMDNCGDRDFNPNSPCYLWGYSWQVGYGVHVGVSIDKLHEATSRMHPELTETNIGQRVIDESKWRYTPTYHKVAPLTYPSKVYTESDLNDIVKSAKAGNSAARAQVATLMKDDGVGMYLIALNFRDIIGMNSGTAAKMAGWSVHYSRQTMINTIKAIYDAGLYQ